MSRKIKIIFSFFIVAFVYQYAQSQPLTVKLGICLQSDLHNDLYPVFKAELEHEFSSSVSVSMEGNFATRKILFPDLNNPIPQSKIRLEDKVIVLRGNYYFCLIKQRIFFTAGVRCTNSENTNILSAENDNHAVYSSVGSIAGWGIKHQVCKRVGVELLASYSPDVYLMESEYPDGGFAQVALTIYYK